MFCPHLGWAMPSANAGPYAFTRLQTACSACRQLTTLIEDGQTTHPNCDPPGGDTEVAVSAVRSVWPDAKVIGQWLTADELFPGSGQCKDCGDPLNQPGLMQRCRARHNVMPA